jgi:hypothetical protein
MIPLFGLDVVKGPRLYAANMFAVPELKKGIATKIQLSRLTSSILLKYTNTS